MKVIFATLTLATCFTFSPQADAKHGDIRPPRRAAATCYAQGRLAYGPIGEIWQTESGRGRDIQDASYTALRNCSNAGLRNCFVQNCWEDR